MKENFENESGLELVHMPTMTNKELFAIWQRQKKEKAKFNPYHKDLKIPYTKKELYNKLAQLGKVLNYKGIKFTFEQGSLGGQLSFGTAKICPATISDFENAVFQKYEIKLFD